MLDDCLYVSTVEYCDIEAGNHVRQDRPAGEWGASEGTISGDIRARHHSHDYISPWPGLAWLVSRQ